MEQSGAQSKSMQNHSSAEKPPSQTQISIKLDIKIKNVNDQQVKEEIISNTKAIHHNHLVQHVVRPILKPISI